MANNEFEKDKAETVSDTLPEFGFIEFPDNSVYVCPLPQMLKFGLERFVKAEAIDLEDEQLEELLEDVVDPQLN